MQTKSDVGTRVPRPCPNVRMRERGLASEIARRGRDRGQICRDMTEWHSFLHKLIPHLVQTTYQRYTTWYANQSKTTAGSTSAKRQETTSLAGGTKKQRGAVDVPGTSSTEVLSQEAAHSIRAQPNRVSGGN